MTTTDGAMLTGSAVAAPPERGRALPGWAAPAALGAILVLAAVLYGWALWSLGWGNAYYAAAVKSMGQSWTNFLFGAYDPAGVITVDKPPAALWPQVVSTKVFGMHGWAMILPQVVEGVAAVFVLHRTVRRWAGEGAALIAALVLTLTPITVAVNRDNNPDTMLVLALVAAAYALTRALQAGPGRSALWWLCGCGSLIGLGFLAKMLAAWMVIPAFAAAWLAGASGPWRARLWRFAAAGTAVAVSSLWWVAAVAFWPGDRPYIGGSTDGGAWDLIVGYNGLGRVFGSSDGQGPTAAMGGSSFGGAPGLGRLFNDQVAGQISWLLPVCAAALAVAVTVAVLRRRGVAAAGAPLPAAGWVLWGGWLLVCAAVFSAQHGIFHPYYTTQLAPAIGALAGGLVTALVRAHRAGARWALPAAAVTVAATSAWGFVVISRVPSWHGWLRWLLVGAGALACVLLLIGGRRRRRLTASLAAGIAAVLIAPGSWSLTVPAAAGAMGGTNPTAGPEIMPFGGGASAGRNGGFPAGLEPPGAAAGGFPGPGNFPGAGGMPGAGGGPGGGGRGGPFGGAATLSTDQRRILDYAVRNSGAARITLAVEGGAQMTSAFILGSDATVVGMGGFTGSDNAPSVKQLETWTATGQLRYVLGNGAGGGGLAAMMGGNADGPAGRRSAWITEHCAEVPAGAYGGDSNAAATNGFPMGATTLYDCAPKGAVQG